MRQGSLSFVTAERLKSEIKDISNKGSDMTVKKWKAQVTGGHPTYVGTPFAELIWFCISELL